jgi:hypothetical protein
MASIAPAAFLGSIAASAFLLIHVPRPHSAPPQSIVVSKRLIKSSGFLLSLSLKLPHPLTLPSYINLLDSLSSTPIPKLQRSISHLLDARLATSIIAAAPAEDRLTIKAHFTTFSALHLFLALHSSHLPRLHPS